MLRALHLYVLAVFGVLGAIMEMVGAFLLLVPWPLGLVLVLGGPQIVGPDRLALAVCAGFVVGFTGHALLEWSSRATVRLGR